MKQHSVEYSDEPGCITRAQRGDGEAFRCLVSFYEPQLVTYLARLLGDQESARDVVQETLLAAHRTLPPALATIIQRRTPFGIALGCFQV